MYYIAVFDEESNKWKKLVVNIGRLSEPKKYKNLGHIEGHTNDRLQTIIHFDSLHLAVYHYLGIKAEEPNSKIELRQTSFDINLPDFIPEELESKIKWIESLKNLNQ
jgi:hypothetical protein